MIGYYQAEVTEDTGTHATPNRSHVLGVGPEVSAFWPNIGLFTSLRYAYEADAQYRPQGHTIALTLTKIF